MPSLLDHPATNTSRTVAASLPSPSTEVLTKRSICAAGLCFLLAACGTNVAGLLEEESRLWWDSYGAIQAAEDLDPALLDPLYAAESAKILACRSVIDAVSHEIDTPHATFSEKLRSDLERLVVRLVPIKSVERCAQAQEAYEEELVALCRRLAGRGVRAKCPG